MFRFVSRLRKPKAILKSFCSVQLSQKSLEKNQFTPDECLPNFYLKFYSSEKPKKPLVLRSTRKRRQQREMKKMFSVKTYAIQEKLRFRIVFLKKTVGVFG